MINQLLKIVQIVFVNELTERSIKKECNLEIYVKKYCG